MGLGYKNATLANVFISDDDVHIHVWDEDEAMRGEELFLALLDVWKIVKRFNP